MSLKLTITKRCAYDCLRRESDGVSYFEIKVDDGGNQRTHFTVYDNITVEYDALGWLAIRVDRANSYRFNVGDTHQGASGDVILQDMYSYIMGQLTGAQPLQTYYILAESGDILNAENNDKLRTE